MLLKYFHKRTNSFTTITKIFSKLLSKENVISLNIKSYDFSKVYFLKK
jgi:hypothetical protein